MKKNNLTIAVLGRDFRWGGGVEFLRLVVNGLLTMQQKYGLTLFLLLPIENKVESPVDMLRVAIHSIKGTLQRKRPWIAKPCSAFHESMLDFFKYTQGGRFEVVYHGSSRGGLLRCLRSIKADVALPVNGTLGRDYPVPWVGYAPDFQHKYLPDYFSARECVDRDIHFGSIFRDSVAVIVNSKSVKNDVSMFYPNTETKVFNLPFSPNALSDWFEDLPVGALDHYGLPEKYFLISNQFWIHKDHLTAFRALERLGLTHDIYIVCTGTMDDYRHPGYITELMEFISAKRLSAHVKLLGHVPKREQIEIMKNSIAVVQPTLFEGGPGGGSVYDAVSLGVPVILSDLPVNREIEEDGLCFFKAGDCDDLAEKMAKAISTNSLRPDKESLLRKGHERLEKLGERLLEAVGYVVQ